MAIKGWTADPYQVTGDCPAGHEWVSGVIGGMVVHPEDLHGWTPDMPQVICNSCDVKFAARFNGGK